MNAHKLAKLVLVYFTAQEAYLKSRARPDMMKMKALEKTLRESCNETLNGPEETPVMQPPTDPLDSLF